MSEGEKPETKTEPWGMPAPEVEETEGDTRERRVDMKKRGD